MNWCAEWLLFYFTSPDYFVCFPGFIIIYCKWHLLSVKPLGKSIYSTKKGKHLSVYKDTIFCKLFVTDLWNERTEFYTYVDSFPFERSNLGFLYVGVKYMAIVFQHSFQGFCLDTTISKNLYCSLTWIFFVNWADEKTGGYNEARQNLDCCRHDSLLNTSEEYVRAAESWKDG